MSLLLDALQQAAKQKQKQGAGADDYRSPAIEHEIEEPDRIEVANEPLFRDDPAETSGGDMPLSGSALNTAAEDALELDLDLDFGHGELDSEAKDTPSYPQKSSAAYHANTETARQPRREPETPTQPIASARGLWRDTPVDTPEPPLQLDEAPTPETPLGIDSPNRQVPAFEQPDGEKALEALIMQSKNSRRSKLEHKVVIGVLLASIAAMAGVFYYAYRFTEAEDNAVAWVQPQDPYAAPLAEDPAVIAPTPVAESAADAAETPQQTAKPETTVAAAPPAYRNAKPKRSTPAPDFEGELGGGIHIQRSHKTPDYRETIDTAYLAYKAGRALEAKRLYRDVLARHPRNRDALLGLAVIAENSGDQDEAIRWFRKMLQLNAKDPYAVAALSQLENSRNHGDKIGEIKALLRENPDSAALHYTLGNLLAENDHWIEAQQSYFKAFSLDKGNADYAFNLAVALDHMGKQEMALRYYEHAVQLANPGHSGFDLNAAQGRISSLRTGQGS